MTFTVLIATLGSAKLSEVISAYLQDEHRDFEVLIIADGPDIDRDKFLGLVRSDDRVKIRFNDKNVGQTKSLNRGLKVATGDIIIRNDDDDIPDPKRLARIRQFFIENPTVDVVSSYARGVSESGGDSWIVTIPHTHAAIKAGLARRNIFVASSVAMRRDAILEVGGYCEVFRYAQDYELYLRLARNGKIFSCIPEVLVDRYYSNSSITVSKRKTQALYSFAARLIHAAETGGLRDAVAPIMRYLLIFIVPNSLRKLRRGLGFGR